MLKKIFSSLVLVLLVWNSLTSFWLTYEVLSEIDAANFLWNKNIIENHILDTEKYRLGYNISRKETIKIMIKVSWLTLEDKCEWIFSDVPNDWSCKYIELALKQGFIVKSDKFRPDDNITKTEALKMILKSKWILKTTKTTNWQEDYMQTAFEYWLIPSKYSDYDAKAKRWWIFQITTATLKKEQQIKNIQSKNQNLYSEEAL